MEISEKYPDLWAGIKNGFESNRLAHAYVVVGQPRGEGLEFVEAFLKLIFCTASQKPCNHCSGCQLVETHKHVDTLWIEPQSKSRKIKVDEVRALVHRVSQTSFEGGWKAGIILAADCMNPSAANALLKTLEEPPAKTLILLVTNSPQALLPTIISRCQKLVLPEENYTNQEFWYEPLLELLREMPPQSGLAAARLASALKAILDQIKKVVSDEISGQFDADEGLDESKLKIILESRVSARLKETQAELFRVILDWHRDVLVLVSSGKEEELLFENDRNILTAQAEKHTQGSALKALQIIEQMVVRLERNLPPLQVFDAAFRTLIC